jgi:hypothetical protein
MHHGKISRINLFMVCGLIFKGHRVTSEEASTVCESFCILNSERDKTTNEHWYVICKRAKPLD